MRTVRRTIAAAIVVAGAALAGCGSRQSAPAAPVAVATGERLQVVAAQIPDLKTVAATVQTRDLADARARIGGTLVSLAVREGDAVRKGELIGRIVDQRLNFETGAAGAQVAAAQAEASRADAELGRTRYLYDNGVYAKARLEQVEAAARAARGSLAAARAQRNASADLAGQGAILAPSEGRVLKADVPAGSVVSPGQSVATVTSGPPVLRIEIPEADARELKIGQSVSVSPEDLPGVTSGLVSQIYPAVTSGRVTVDVTAPGLRAELVGQRVRVQVPVGQRTALLIPTRFVSHRYGLDYVRVLGRGGASSEVAVQLAPGPDPGRMEVLSGLTSGDTIVAPGA